MSETGQTTELPVKPGDVLAGRYRVERVLGAGNMGVVVAAVHVTLEERVALKFILPGTAGKQDEKVTRFLREAKACAKLKSQHVAKVSDIGTLENGAPFMAMEYLEGRDLDAIVGERGPLPVTEAVGHALQACDALAEAHAMGIVHRDIKPANLFLTRDNKGLPCIKVLDFGISKFNAELVKLTAQETALGSPLYMSPEHIKSSASVDPRSDIWSLGVTLYELVTGKTPFDADRIDALCAHILHGEPAPPSKHRANLPAGFQAALMRCLAKDPAQRYADVAQLAAALEPFGPPRVSSAAAVAAALGVAAPASSKPAEPGAPGSAPAATAASTNRAASTGSGVAGTIGSPTALVPPKATRRGPAAAVVALGLAVAGVAGFFVVRAQLGTAAPTAATPSAATAATTTAPALPVPSVAPAEALPDAGAPSAPPPEPAATATPSALPHAGPPAKGKTQQPTKPEPVAEPPPAAPPPATKPAPVKPGPTTYHL